MRAILFAGLLAIFGLIACQQKWHVASTEVSNYRMAKSSNISEPAIDSIIAPYRRQLSAEMDEIIGMAAIDLNKSKPESNMGNWIGDLLKEEAEILHNGPIDFAIQNYGGLRISSVAKGPVTKGKVFELMPFDNQLIIVHVPHNELLLLLNKIADYGGWPVSEGLQMTITNGLASNVKIGGEPIRKDKIYLVAMPDYIANGGDNCFFLSPLKRDEYGVFIRDAMLQNIKKKHDEGIKISAKIEGRIN